MIFFHNGYLIDAEQDDLTGDKAVLSMLEWKKIKVTMNEFCPSTSKPATGRIFASDTPSQLISLLSDMSYHTAQYTGVGIGPLDKAHQEFIQLQKKT